MWEYEDQPRPGAPRTSLVSFAGRRSACQVRRCDRRFSRQIARKKDPWPAIHRVDAALAPEDRAVGYPRIQPQCPSRFPGMALRPLAEDRGAADSLRLDQQRSTLSKRSEGGASACEESKNRPLCSPAVG